MSLYVLSLNIGAAPIDPEVLLAALKIAVGAFAAAALVLLVKAGVSPLRRSIGTVLAFISAAGAWSTGALLSRWTLSPVIFAALGIALFALGFFLNTRKADTPRSVRLSWAALCLTGALLWTNFGTFHGDRVFHHWEIFHYYLGAKYFPELGYDNLYDCVLLAGVSDGRDLRHLAGQRRDLETNTVESAHRAVDRSLECREGFKPERWAAFRHDVRLMRSFSHPGMWAAQLTDHGYNASPTWTAVGYPLANIGWRDLPPPDHLVPATTNPALSDPAVRRAAVQRFRVDRHRFAQTIAGLAAIDFALYGLLFGIFFWAFGLEALAIALFVFGAGQPWEYGWTGGSFGRSFFMFFAAGGLALARRGYPGSAGVILAASTSMRIFPGATLFGSAATVLSRAVRRKASDPGTRNHARLLIGATLGIVAIGAVTAAVVGTHAFSQFARNTAVHEATQMGNLVGLPRLIGWSPFEPGAFAFGSHPGNIAGCAVYAAALGLAGWAILKYGRRLQPWEAAALGPAFALTLVNMTCYYGVFLVLLAPLALQSRFRTAVLVFGVLATQVLELFPGLGDTRYIFLSAGLLAVAWTVVIDRLRINPAV